jgi:hypothetical protein
LVAYQWENLYYCCDVCQTAANHQPSFQATLRPDSLDYTFDRYFYYDNELGEVKVMENLLDEELMLAKQFLERYGIDSNPILKQVRKNEYKNIRNALQDPEDGRTRDDFSFRWIYDEVATEMRF